MPLTLAVIAMFALVVGMLDAYQAITGNRVSKAPSRRTDEEMRRQSAIAAAVLLPLGLLVAALALLS